jgi:pre-rRNA-processing protein RIX1
LVHKLKTNISTLLNGRSREGRFAAVGLIKATVDIGGWEVLRDSESWVRGLISIVQVGSGQLFREISY